MNAADENPPPSDNSEVLDQLHDGQSNRLLRRDKSVKQILNPLQAQSTYSKFQRRLRRLTSFMDEQDDDDETATVDNRNKCQTNNTDERYRIRSIDHDTTWFDHTSEHLVIALLTNYFKWTFRSSFLKVILSACALYILWIFLFAVLIYIVMRKVPECIAGNEEGLFFADAYHLSWTTLSTVGYGVIGPTIASHRCLGINVLMAYESFFGVLYASLVGAIVFSKIARIQSVAAVRFSRVICVRYGTGVLEPETNETDDEGEVPNDDALEPNEHSPCPILEFRLINGLSDSSGGEIIDASIRVVACVVDEDDEHDLNLKEKQKTAKQRLKTCQVAQAAAAKLVGAGRLAGNAAGKTVEGVRKIAGATTGNIIQQVNWAILHQNSRDPVISNPTVLVDRVETQQEIEKELQKYGSVTLTEGARSVVPVDEGNSKLLPPRKYHKLQIETDEHPYFNRSWIIRHILDETSPLLSAHARRRILEHQGKWPFQTYQDVRQHLKFTQMIVTFSGTANASGTSVYAQTVYDFDSVFVGYGFANLLTRQKGKWVVDAELINDIREQKGGGGEPIGDETNGVLLRDVPMEEFFESEATNKNDAPTSEMKMIPEGEATSSDLP